MKTFSRITTCLIIYMFIVTNASNVFAQQDIEDTAAVSERNSESDLYLEIQVLKNQISILENKLALLVAKLKR